MKKANYHGIQDIRVEAVDLPELESDQVRVKIKYCGICGSDVHEYLHGPFPRSPFGHEACGEIVEKGSDVSRVDVGDRVLAFGPGAYAEYFTTSENTVTPLSPSISWERAVVMEPLAGAAYAVKRSGLKADDTLLITGAGPVGLMLLLSARATGVKTIYMTELSPTRIDKAMAMGATEVFNPVQVHVPSKIKEMTDGNGVDVSIEAVGVQDSLKDCLASTRYRGTVVVQGIFTDRVPVHMLGFVTREITMIGTNSIDMDLAMEWVGSKDIKPEEMITSTIALDDIATNGFDKLIEPQTDQVKVLVEP